MKQGTWITRLVVILLFGAVVAYLGISLWQGLSEPYRMVVSYADHLEDAVALEGLVVREETVVGGRSDLTEVLPAEGERVRVGGAVAAVYTSAQSLENHRSAKALELQLDQLKYAMGRNDAVGDGASLDAQLVTNLAQLKSDVSAGNLTNLEDSGLAIRSLVAKRTSAASSNAQSTAALQSAAADLEAQLTALKTTNAQGTRYITVEQSGLFSGLVDGYEALITPADLEALTCAQLTSLKSQPVSPDSGAVGKLVLGSKWYFAATVDEQTAQRLNVGSKYDLDFSGDFDREVAMTLDRLGPKENGQRVAVFSCNKYLSQVTLARLENVSLVFQRYTGVRVPDRALRVRDNEDGSTTLGVYALVGRQAEFKPVEIVREGEGYYLLKGTATNRKVLRAGDMIILSGQELYDGKVVA